MPDAPSPLVISRITVEPPEGWGPRRMLITRLRALGYAVEEYIVAGVSVLVITGTRAAASRPGTLAALAGKIAHWGRGWRHHHRVIGES